MSQPSFNVRIVREYVKLTVEKVVADIYGALHSKYDKMIYSEKIKYTNSKEYRRKRRTASSDLEESFSAQLGYWSPHQRDGASNAPHISSDTYGGRVFNGIVEGFTPSITEDDYVAQEVQRIIDNFSDNDVVLMVKLCLAEPASWREKSPYEDFCNKHLQGCSQSIIQQLKEIDAFLNNSYTNRDSVRTKNGLYVYENKIEGNPFGSAYKKELEQVEDDCEVDVLILETNKTSHFVIYTNVFPSHQNVVGLKVGDTFSLPDIPYTYQIQKIF